MNISLSHLMVLCIFILKYFIYICFIKGSKFVNNYSLVHKVLIAILTYYCKIYKIMVTVF